MEEQWKDLPHTNYSISNHGRVKHNIKGCYVKQRPNKLGYGIVDIKGYKRLVHRIVAEYFIPNPEQKPDVNHIDGNKLNNHVSNLEWVTTHENNKHAIRTGLLKCTITMEIAKEIRHDKEIKGLRLIDISRNRNIGYGTVRSVVRYESYTNDEIHS